MAAQPKKQAPAPKPNKLESFIQDVTNRYRVTAREARDIVTAAGTYMNSANASQGKAAKSNIAKQVAETVTAAKTGNKGTTSDKATIKMAKDKPNTYTKGTQR